MTTTTNTARKTYNLTAIMGRSSYSMRIESEKLCGAVCDILESNGFAIEHSGNDKMIIVRW